MPGGPGSWEGTQPSKCTAQTALRARASLPHCVSSGWLCVQQWAVAEGLWPARGPLHAGQQARPREATPLSGCLARRGGVRLRRCGSSHLGDLRDKPKPETTGMEALNYRYCPMPSCVSWGNCALEGAWLGTVVTSSAKHPQPRESMVGACVG